MSTIHIFSKAIYICPIFVPLLNPFVMLLLSLVKLQNRKIFHANVKANKTASTCDLCADVSVLGQIKSSE